MLYAFVVLLNGIFKKIFLWRRDENKFLTEDNIRIKGLIKISLISTVLFLVACGGGESPTGKSTDGGDQTQTDAPAISTTPISVVPEGGVYVYSFSVDHPIQNSLSFRLLEAPSGMTIDHANQQVRWNYLEAEAGTYNVTLQVSDATGNSVQQVFTVTVPEEALIPNLPPVFLTTPSSALNEGELFSYSLSAEDPEGEEVTFSLAEAPDGAELNSETFEVTWSPNYEQSGNHRLVVRATDADGQTTDQINIIAVAHVNRAPAFSSQAPTSGMEAVLFEYTMAALEPDGDDVSFFIIEAPLGAALGNDGRTIQWMPSYNEAGDYQFEVLVNDPRGLSDRQEFTVSIANNNRAPQFTSTPASSIAEGDMYLYEISVSDLDGDDLNIEIVSAPVDAVLIENNGVTTFAWTPDYSASGQVDIQLQVTDAHNASAPQAFQLTVENTNRPPVFTSTPTAGVVQGEEYSYEIQISDPDNDNFTIELSSAPANVVYDSNNQRIIWTPTVDQVGDHDLQLVATDNNGDQTVQPFSVTVNAAPIIYVVEWDVPEVRETGYELNAATDIVSYEILYRKVGDDEFQEMEVLGGASTEYELELPLTGTYEILISAKDINDVYSQYSEPITVEVDNI